MPHINIFNDYYYVNDGKYVHENDSNLKYDKLIITNESLFFQPNGNIIDMRIFKWLINNYYNIKLDDRPPILSKTYLIDLNKSNEKLINDNQHLIEQGKQFTKYYQVINKVHEFKYNVNVYNNLIEKQKMRENIKGRVATFSFKSLEELNWLGKGIKYGFLNVNGRISGRGFNLTKFDRKNHLNLFKTDKEKKYFHIDFSSFEPRILFGIYLDKRIDYQEEANYFEIERGVFKELFIAWLNGAGDGTVKGYTTAFETRYNEVVELRNKLTSNVMINYYNHRIQTDQSYKRLGMLMQSTAYDYLKEVYLKIYEYEYKDKVKVRWSLFDEMFIETDSDFDINGWINYIKIFDFMEIKVKEV